MKDLNRCKSQLIHTLDTQPVLQEHFRDLLSVSRWTEYKALCLDHFGSVAAIQAFIKTPGDITLTPGIVVDTLQKDIKKTKESGKTLVDEVAADMEHGVAELKQEHPWAREVIQSWDVQQWFLWWLWVALRWFIAVIVGIMIRKSLLYLFEFAYDVFNSHRLVFMKVLLPRWDSKADRDIAKEIAKDMKEKISRMSQVYTSLHKLGHLSVRDNLMRWMFGKAKVTFMLHYEDSQLHFIVSTYPEYKKIIESAIGAQYADASIEIMDQPKLFKKDFDNIIPMQAVKEWAYPIRTYKQLADDPMNNIIDSIAKISPEDTFTMLFTIKPASEAFNKRAQRLAEALYKKDEAIMHKNRLSRLMPWTWLWFLIHGPSDKLIERFSSTKKWGDPLVRMVKAEEEALNTMAEEAWKPAYEWWILLATSSADHKRIQENIYNVVSAFTVYADEYNNELDQPETWADLFGRILKPLWKFSANNHLVNFFFRDNIFTVSELSSLFHLPDGLYNRSNIIKWMDYKVIAKPDNLPALKEANPDFMVTWIIAEEFRWGNISKILSWTKLHDVTKKVEKHEKKQMIRTKEQFAKAKDIVRKLGTERAEILKEDGHTFLLTKKIDKKVALKTYKDGILLWLNVYRNSYTPVYMKKKDRTRHHYIIGKSGTGKSVYISMLARQDIRAWAWVCVIDPHGDLVEDILQYVPKERAKDVVYFDAWNEERPMGLNLFEINHIAEADRAVNDAVEIFVKMFGPEIFWPRIQEYFKYGSLTLLEDMEEGATLIDVPRLFTDEVFREYKTKKVKNPVVKNFRDKTYNAMGDREKQEIIPYFTSKFVSFITNSLIRNIIGQTKSAFDFRDVMDNEKILLINLSKWNIGQLNAQLLWMILVSKIYNAAMSRANIPEKERKFFYTYVDEFQNFITDTFADILSEARKYKLCLIMAHQFIAQLDSNAWSNIGEGKSQVKDAVFGNVWTMQSFKVGAPDAEFLEKEYSPVLVAQDILWIANYKAYIKLNINNTTSRVFSLNSIWTQDYQNEKVREILKEYCAKKYGRKKEFVDAEISARLGMMIDEEIESDEWETNDVEWSSAVSQDWLD